MSISARAWLDRIRALPLPPRVGIMNVCGGHERSISMAGLRGALPPQVELIPGPGCPVCEDVYHAMQVALHDPDAIVVSFGDMLRVPVNLALKETRSLEQAKAAGGDVRPVATPLEAAEIAAHNPGRRGVFFAAGFETTTAPVAALLAADAPPNLLVLLSGRQCRIYGSACTSRTPIGPCMVSDEGACRIWWSNGARTREVA